MRNHLKTSSHSDRKCRESITVFTVQMNLCLYQEWKKLYLYIWKQSKIFLKSDRFLKSVGLQQKL